MVPIDKMRPQNIEDYDAYCAYVKGISARQFCFVDEKSLKGAELYNTKGRSDPLTGLAPVNVVTPDFRNTYCLIGMCSIDNSKQKPFIYNIG